MTMTSVNQKKNNGQHMNVQYIVNGKIICEKPGTIYWKEHLQTIKNVAFEYNVSFAQVIVKYITN